MFNDVCLIKYGLIDVINMLIIDYNYIVGEFFFLSCSLLPSLLSPPPPFLSVGIKTTGLGAAH